MKIDTAVILAAGEGSRLRSKCPYKPLCPVNESALLDHALHGLHRAGIKRAIVITGYGGDVVEQHLQVGDWPIPVEAVRSPDWRLPNGTSALAAAKALSGRPTLLAMCDHLVDPEIYARMKQAGAGPGLRLAIDRVLDTDLIDPLDVTRVRTEGCAIAAIGKELEPFDAYDAGVFAVATPFFEALRDLAAPSITDGVRALIPAGRAEIVDCSRLFWVDVDDREALEKAEKAARAHGLTGQTRAQHSQSSPI